MLNLDTHILLFALADDLSRTEEKLLRSQPWSISAIVLWEITKLAQLGRISLDIESSDFYRLLSAVHIWPIELAVCRKIKQLDFRGDPTDEIIAATSLAHAVPLLTRDKAIRKSKIVPLVAI